MYMYAIFLFPEKARIIWRLKCEKRNSKAEQNTLWMDGWTTFSSWKRRTFISDELKDNIELMAVMDYCNL